MIATELKLFFDLNFKVSLSAHLKNSLPSATE